jgi:ADP-ribose pyrophosphatase YjhB (NUDIX family)
MTKELSTVIKATVILLINKEGKVILARKKQPIHTSEDAIEYSLGLYNGYGGKMEETDGTIEQAALRELHQEANVVATVESLSNPLIVNFKKQKDNNESDFMKVYFYTVQEYFGDPQETREMGAPEVFYQNALPYDEMMPADKVIFEKLLRHDHRELDVILRGKDMLPVVRETTLRDNEMGNETKREGSESALSNE